MIHYVIVWWILIIRYEKLKRADCADSCHEMKGRGEKRVRGYGMWLQGKRDGERRGVGEINKDWGVMHLSMSCPTLPPWGKDWGK